MTLWSRLMTTLATGWQATNAAYFAARRVFEEPDQRLRSSATWSDVQSAYSLLWAYYSNSLFDRGSTAWTAWTAYKSMYTLYRNIRLIYNPTRRLVDFYAGQVYPGVLSIDGSSDLPAGMQSAIPLSHEVDSRLRAAIAQFWQWSNWQSRKSVLVRWGAALGSVLIEVVDDLERGKVAAEILWPGFVQNLELDSAGNVKAYALEYLTQDSETGQTYTYRKEVDGTSFRHFRNGERVQTFPNQYGFVPAVWIKHIDTGTLQGSPAIAGSLGKIDELNGLASHVHDQIHKVIGAPVVLWSAGALSSLFRQEKRGATADFVEPTGDQENVLMLKGPADGRLDSLAGKLELGDAALYMDKLLGEIEQDHPELVFYKELRSMSQVTGPAASRLVGDVSSRVAEVSAQYDVQCVKLFQMAVAIAGMRASGGGWGRTLSRQQQKFLPFSLASYERGDLDVSILPRPVLIPTRQEVANEQQAIWQGVSLAVKAGVPLEVALLDEGWTEEDLARLKAYAPPPPPPPPPLPEPPVPPSAQVTNPSQEPSSQNLL